MDKPTKALIGGVICAVLVITGGIANNYWIESKVRSLEAECARPLAGTDMKPLQSGQHHFVPTCDFKTLLLLEQGGLQGIQAEIVATQRQTSVSEYWTYIGALAVFLLSAIPWLWYFLLRRIRELREAILGK